MKKEYAKILKVHILCGLPGSGKTTWAENQCSLDKDNRAIISLDKYRNDRNVTIKDIIHVNSHAFMYNEDVYIDGLFLTQKQVNDFVHDLVECLDTNEDFFLRSPDKLHIIIEYWTENREACESNDIDRVNSGARDERSISTIKNAVYERIFKEDVEHAVDQFYGSKTEHRNGPKMEISVELYEHETEKYSSIEKYIHDNYNVVGDVLKSEEWSLGGTWGNYLGHRGTIEADERPEFNELDKILEHIAPNITFLQYKNLLKNHVKIIETERNDYYGGWETLAHYEANIKEIYDWLKENNLIKE